MTWTFSPPARTAIPRLTAELRARPDDPATRLGRFITTGTRRVNVWRLTDGTFTETQPSDADSVDRWFQGGAVHSVTAAEAAALEAAGYDCDFTGDEPPPDDGDEGFGAGFGGEPYGEMPYGGSD